MVSHLRRDPQRRRIGAGFRKCGGGGTSTTSGSFSYDSGYNVVNAVVKNRIMERYTNYTCYADGK